jgi:hypothetical protein
MEPPAKEVYQLFGANTINMENGVYWTSCLATTHELEIALHLLRESTLCFLKSLTTIDIDNEIKNITALPKLENIHVGATEQDTSGGTSVTEKLINEWKNLVI